MTDDVLRDDLRLVEAMLFAAAEPLSVRDIEAQVEGGGSVAGIIEELVQIYAARGINLVQIGDGWAFRTAVDLAPLLTKYKVVQSKLSKVALETLAIIAYHQPVTRAEIEDVRGVQTSKGTLDVLLETGWVKMRGRRRAPGRPITYGTTNLFLDQFGLARVDDLPGLAELKGAGLLEGALPAEFAVPQPSDDAKLRDDEEPLEDEMGDEPDPLRFASDDLFDEQE